jgi:hypothetical protein
VKHRESISKAASTSSNLGNASTWWTSSFNATYKKEDKKEKPKKGENIGGRPEGDQIKHESG